MNDAAPGKPGLRERKKLATHQALSWAAIRLAVERGPENVRVEEIAAAAGVSTRTYNNYFATKEEAICGFVVSRGEGIRAALLERPAEEPLGEAILAAIMEQFETPEPDRESVVRTRLVVSTPALQGEYLKAMAVTERYLADAIAHRSGIRMERDLYPQVLAAAVTAATRVGVEHWINSGTGRFTTVVARAIRECLAGVAAKQTRGRRDGRVGAPSSRGMSRTSPAQGRTR